MIATGDFRSDVLTFLEQEEDGQHFKSEVWDETKVSYLDELRSINGPLMRAHVFAAFSESTHKGATFALVWGYPDGKTHGKSDKGRAGLQDALSDLSVLTDAVDQLRNYPRKARDTLELLNRIEGLSIASTTKVAYFAKLETLEGPCLIYDRQVAKASLSLDYPELKELRRALCPTLDALPAPKSVIDRTAGRSLSYGPYLTHAANLAKFVGKGTSPDDIERFLFTRGRELR